MPEALTFTITGVDEGSKVFSQFANNVAKAGGRIEREADRLGDAGKRGGSEFGKGLLGALTGILTVEAVKGAFTAIVGGASDLGETMSKTDVVFGKSAKAIHSWAAEADKSMGMSQQAAESNANSLGLLFTQLGFNASGASTMSQKWVQLAADLGSFNNADPTEILGAMQSATRGEYDELQRFVPLINAAAVEQEAMKIAGTNSTDMITDQHKALAIQKLMFQQTGKAQGDFARTQDSVANRTKIAQASIENAAAAFGTALLPAVAAVLGFISNELIPTIENLGDAWNDLPGPVQTAAQVMAGLFAAGAIGIPTFTRLKGAVQGASAAFHGMSKASRIALLSLGPLGLALAAGATILTMFANNAAETEGHVDDLKNTLDDLTGAVTEDTRVWMLNELRSRGVLDEAKKLGIGLNQLVSGGISPTSEAGKQLATVLDINIDRANTYGDATRQVTSEDIKHRDAAIAIRDALLEMNGELTEAQKKKLQEIEVTGKATEKEQKLAQAHQDAADKAKAQAEALQKLIDGLTKLSEGALDVSRAESNFQAALDKVSEAVKKNGKTLDDHTEKGRNNKAALEEIISSTNDVIQSRAKQGASETTLKALQERGIASLIRSARQMGMNGKEARKLAEQYFGIPAVRRTLLNAEKKDAEKKIRDLQAKLKGVHNKKTEAKIRADIRAAQAQLKRIRDQLAGVKSKTITLKIMRERHDYYYKHYRTGQERGDKSERAMGGPVDAGMTYLVGERGPELFTAQRTGKIIPASETASMLRGFARGEPMPFPHKGRGLPGGELHFHFHNVVSSERQLEDLVVRTLDSAARKGRLPRQIVTRR